MKKLGFLFLCVSLMFALVSCDESNAPEETTAATEAAAASADATADAATPEQTALPPAQQRAESMAKTTAEFSEMEYDWGTVTDGDIMRHTFSFTNTGDSELVLQNVKPSCGCTATNWTREPVAPGETGEIEVEFNSKGKPGMQAKTITVTGNFNDGLHKILRIKGQVDPAN